MLAWFLLVLSAIFFSGAALTVVKAPVLWTWMVAILVDEFGQWLIWVAVALAFAAWRCYRSSLSSVPLVATGLAVLAALLLALPSVRAWRLSRALPQELVRAFGPSSAPAPAFDWARLYSLSALRSAPPDGAPETFVFSREGTPDATALDLYRSRKPGAPAPCIVSIHGGGWDNGDRLQLAEINRRWASEGFVVAAIDYRLAPRWAWPAQEEDVLTAIAYLKAHAAAFGIDPDRFVLFGRSAGGQIATATAYATDEPSIRGVMAFYSPHDLNFAWKYARPDDVLNSLLLLKQYTGGTPETRQSVYDGGSALLHVSHSSPPTLLVHGELDTLVWHRQSERLDAKLASEGVPHLFVSLPWATHAFDFNLDGPGGQVALEAVSGFLNAVAGPGSRAVHSTLDAAAPSK